VWQGVKDRNIDAYDVKLVHRPFSEHPGDAVSEGQGYGMILALYHNDPVYFNTIWDNAETYMWQPGLGYDWRVDPYGNVMGRGPATVSVCFCESKKYATLETKKIRET
jgi:hypothetical protein